MNDVKEICDVMLEVPEPPLRTGAEVLAVARRSTSRRTGLRVAGAGLAAAAAVAVVTSAPGVLARSDPADAPLAATRSVAPAPVVVPPALPGWQQTDAHGDQVLRLLLAAVPAEYAARPEYGDSDSTATLQLGRPGAEEPLPYASSTSVLVAADGQEGRLAAFVGADGKPAPTDELCSATVAARMTPLIGPADAGCEVITVDGVPIRVTAQLDPEVGQVKAATRFLTGGYLTIFVQQGTPAYQPDESQPPPDALRSRSSDATGKPRLGTLPLTSAQAAALAANPAILP